MKRIILSMLFLTATITQIMAQEPRPEWVRSSPRSKNFIYASGMGIGVDEDEAVSKAWVDAIKTALHEGGLIGIVSQSLDGVHTKRDLDAMIPVTTLPRSRVCQTPQIYTANGKVKVYILLQVQRDGSKKTDFYDPDVKSIECESADFKQEVKEWNKDEVERQKQARKDEANRQKQAARGAARSEMFNGRSYVTWAMLCGGYPWNAATGLVGRHGGTLGIGYQLTLGADASSNFYYSAGLRLYPHKGLFLSASYGIIGGENVNPFNDSEGRFGTKGTRQGKGISFTAGYDLFDISNAPISVTGLSIDAGLAYDTFMGNWKPVINLKLCFGGKL
jgi:hypothetical protein